MNRWQIVFQRGHSIPHLTCSSALWHYHFPIENWILFLNLPESEQTYWLLSQIKCSQIDSVPTPDVAFNRTDSDSSSWKLVPHKKCCCPESIMLWEGKAIRRGHRGWGAMEREKERSTKVPNVWVRNPLWISCTLQNSDHSILRHLSATKENDYTAEQKQITELWDMVMMYYWFKLVSFGVFVTQE